MPRTTTTWECVRDDDSEVEDDVAIPQARAIHMSSDGRRVLETPRSPVKRFSAAVPPTHEADFDDPPLPILDENPFDLEEDEMAAPTVGAKLAKKRYPTSVRSHFAHLNAKSAN